MSSWTGAKFEPQASTADAANVGASESELFSRARSGDRGAFGSLVVRYQDRIYSTVLRMVGDHEEARELTQETFCRALMKLGAFRGESQPYTWLFRIAVNLSISRLRKVKRRRTFSLDAPSQAGASDGGDDQAAGLVQRLAGDEPGPAEHVEQREQMQQMLDALSRCDPEDRALIVLRDIEGFDYQQLAEMLGLPLGTLKSKLFRARKALVEQLKDYLKD